MGLLAAEAFSSRRMNRCLWRDGFMVTVTRERLGIGRTPSEVEGQPAIPWGAEVWVHGEDGQIPRSLPFVKARLKLPPPERVHLLDGSLYSHAGPADFGELDRVVRVMVGYAKELSAEARRIRGQAFEAAMAPSGAGHRAHQRLQALDLLLTHFPGSLEADLAAKDAVMDADCRVRLRAARALGDAGLGAVQTILLDDQSPHDLRVQALTHLAKNLGRPALVPMLIEVLDTEVPDLRREATRLAGKLQVRDAVPLLLQHVRTANPSDRRQILFALGRIGDPRAEALALVHLDDEDPDVCREAVRCLGRVGRPDAVVSRLRQWLRGERPPAIRELAEAVLSALGRPVDERGQLSLVTDDGLGAVSVPETEGAVALISDGLHKPGAS